MILLSLVMSSWGRAIIAPMNSEVVEAVALAAASVTASSGELVNVMGEMPCSKKNKNTAIYKFNYNR
jgi:hypothetical protein